MRFLLLCWLWIPSAFAADCGESSLVHFFVGNQEVPSQVIGADDDCDQFGGNLAYTPKHQLYLYVNFNIPGRIALDEVDSAFELAPKSGRLHDWYASLKIAVVADGWIKRVYGDDREAIINFGNDTLFITGKVITEGRLTPLLREFYDSRVR